MKHKDLIQKYEKVFKAHKDRLTTTSKVSNPKMEYHTMADAIFWEDEGLREWGFELENSLRHVINYRTTLITEAKHDVKNEDLNRYIFELAKVYFPDWIGFQEARCSYNAQLASRIKRIRKVSNWKIEKLFNEEFEE